MKIVITGATGFIGSHITSRLLEEGYEVCALVRAGYKPLKALEASGEGRLSYLIYDGTLECLLRGFRLHKPEMVIHLAAYYTGSHTPENLDRLIDSNIRLSAHLLEAMKQNGVFKLINTSTTWQHYHDEAYNPVCLYAATKQCVEDFIKYYSEAEGLSAVTLTIYDSYGYRDSRSKIISLLDQCRRSGSPLSMSAGEQQLDLIYIDDIVDAYLNAVWKLTNHIGKLYAKYYLCSGHPVSLREVIKIYEKVYGVTLCVELGKRPYKEREVMKAYEGGERLPGWLPKYNLHSGLSLMRRLEEMEKTL